VQPDLLRKVIVDAVGGRFPHPDGSVEVIPPWRPGVEGVVSLTGRAYVATSREPSELHRWGLDGFGAALDPRFLAWLAGTHGWCDCLDLLLAATGTGTGGPERISGVDGERLRHARAVRSDVVTHGDHRGVVTVGTGIAGLVEIGVEVVAERRGQGAGRGLVADALGLAPAGAPVLAAVAPGNAASVRAFLAAGFTPIGSVQLVRPSG
jgi:hypothetical protein